MCEQKAAGERNCSREDLLLYAVTDRSWLHGRTLYSQVEEALQGGATFIQLREKALDRKELVREAGEIQELCRKYHIPFVIDDEVSIAKEIDADGVHVGQSDMEAGDVRALLGPDKILGVSARTVEQAVLAEKRGADYLGVGAVFHTGSKADAQDITRETLRAICSAVKIPVIAIGGINTGNVMELAGSGICGVAVISAIFAGPDVREAARELRRATEKMLGAVPEKTMRATPEKTMRATPEKTMRATPEKTLGAATEKMPGAVPEELMRG